MRYIVIWLAVRLFNRNRFWLCIPNPGCNHSWRLLFMPKNFADGKRSYCLAKDFTSNNPISKLCEEFHIYPEY